MTILVISDDLTLQISSNIIMECKLWIGKMKKKAGFTYFKLIAENFAGDVKISKNTSVSWI
jgi:hypothetical protein